MTATRPFAMRSVVDESAEEPIVSPYTFKLVGPCDTKHGIAEGVVLESFLVSQAVVTVTVAVVTTVPVPGITSYQLLYRSTDASNNPTSVVTT